MNTRFTLVTLAAVLTFGAAQAQTCNPNLTRSAPDSRYLLVPDSGGSEVLDTQTQLIWQRCSLGQTWSGSTCTGKASNHSWTDALEKAKAIGNGYRLPTIKELQSLVDEACYSSAINGTSFPATPNKSYWSASPYASGNISAWLVSFRDGNTDYDAKSYKTHVRAVRTGR